MVVEKVTLAMERVAALRARQRADSARWDMNVALLLFAILILVVILSFQDVPLGVVGPVAVTGLVVAWLMGWYKGRAAYPSLYEEELARLIRESLVAKAARRSREKLVDDAVQKALRERQK